MKGFKIQVLSREDRADKTPLSLRDFAEALASFGLAAKSIIQRLLPSLLIPQGLAGGRNKQAEQVRHQVD